MDEGSISFGLFRRTAKRWAAKVFESARADDGQKRRRACSGSGPHRRSTTRRSARLKNKEKREKKHGVARPGRRPARSGNRAASIARAPVRRHRAPRIYPTIQMQQLAVGSCLEVLLLLSSHGHRKIGRSMRD